MGLRIKQRPYKIKLRRWPSNIFAIAYVGGQFFLVKHFFGFSISVLYLFGLALSWSLLSPTIRMRAKRKNFKLSFINFLFQMRNFKSFSPNLKCFYILIIGLFFYFSMSSSLFKDFYFALIGAISGLAGMKIDQVHFSKKRAYVHVPKKASP